MRTAPLLLQCHAALTALMRIVSVGCGDDDGSNQMRGSGVASPTIEGPVTGGTGRPFVAGTAFDLAEIGYSEAEYFISGTATAYVNDGELPADGRWTVTPGETAAYKTRILVYKPMD